MSNVNNLISEYWELSNSEREEFESKKFLKTVYPKWWESRPSSTGISWFDRVVLNKAMAQYRLQWIFDEFYNGRETDWSVTNASQQEKFTLLLDPEIGGPSIQAITSWHKGVPVATKTPKLDHVLELMGEWTEYLWMSYSEPREVVT